MIRIFELQLVDDQVARLRIDTDQQYLDIGTQDEGLRQAVETVGRRGHGILWEALEDDGLTIHVIREMSFIDAELGVALEDELVMAGVVKVTEIPLQHPRKAHAGGNIMTAATRHFQYRGMQFEATKTSPASATVNIACGLHIHEDFIIGIAENDAIGWVVGRAGSGYPQDGNFLDVVEHTANLLYEECAAMRQIEGFFEDDEWFELLSVEDLLPDDSDD